MDPDDFDRTAGPLGGAEPAAVCRDAHKTYLIGDKQIEALTNMDRERVDVAEERGRV